MNDFICLTLSPAALGSPALVLATARAGGIGLFDLEGCPARSFAGFKQTLFELSTQLQPGQMVGLRLLAEQIELITDPGLLECFQLTPPWIILAGWHHSTLAEDLSKLSSLGQPRLLLEITCLKQADDLDPRLPLAGLVGKGQEAGGWCGSESAFILLQGLLRRGQWPVYLQGAIGVYTASACWAAGAQGVVLDDALWQLPESPLPPAWKDRLAGCSGQDSLLLGDQDLQQPRLRVLRRPGWPAVEQLRLVSEQDPNWRDKARALVGWGDPDAYAWPIGQGIGEAGRLRQRYRTVGRLIRAIYNEGERILSQVRLAPQLGADGPLARTLGTRYPIVQGPMTRVSDRPEFALAIAEAGAMPMLALALLEPKRVESLLAETQAKLGSRPWGVGLLGFAPPELLAAQIAWVLRFKPSCALIAGGRPDQARTLEEAGIPTWLHAPTPALARLYIEQGARRLIFEGRECGGHVGPLGGFALWEGVVANLLELPGPLIRELKLLFAGGIHDRRSTQWIEALAAPLTARGAQIGILIGTAYLFTHEALQTGAITPVFQQEALACRETLTLETGPGHASRCALTPFVDTFKETAQRLRAEGRTQSEISQALDDLCLGRLRLAAKGLIRQGPEIMTIDPKTQYQEGFFMIGQVAALRDQVIGIAELHRTLCELPIAWPEPRLSPPVPQPSDIAIIGIGLILPGAQSAPGFWHNLLAQIPAISEIPPERWDWRLYYDPDPQAPDRVYSKWGCLIDEIPFDPTRFGIPPKALDSIDPMQLVALEAVRRALADAGYLEGEFDHEQTAVIIGASGGLGELGEHYVTRSELTARLVDPGPLLEDLPEWTEDTFPGILLNVIAGRVANRFDLGGANFVVDSACASSLTAIELAVAQLESGRCRLAIAGGVDTKLSPFGYLCFSKTPALTPKDHSRPFDAEADGILLGEGTAMVVLKRLAEAEADGDRIYAVIKSAASASDGKAVGLTAPRLEGQRRAFLRAYQKAGTDPATLGLYEAHATGTPLGDETEVASIAGFLAEQGAPPANCVVGSHKALIGHTKATAGVSGLIKAALALYYRTLPAQPFVIRPLAPFTDPQGPLALLREPHPWLAPAHPRRAAVSAFGFGGTNCHCVLEEYRDPSREPPPGSDLWPCELILLAADDQRGLVAALDRLEQRLSDRSLSLSQLAAECAEAVKPGCAATYRAALVVRDHTELSDALMRIRGHLTDQSGVPLPPHLQLGLGLTEPGPLAMLFPGQGSQYLGMGREVALYWEPMRQTIEGSERVLREHLDRPLSHFFWPRRLWDQEALESAERALTETRIAQPALGAISLGYWALLQRVGIQPAFVAGHSYGEYVALAAAGSLSLEDLIWLSYRRGQAMAQAPEGGMIAVRAAPETLAEPLSDTAVVVANHNAPDQCVLSGGPAELAAVSERLRLQGIAIRPLSVSGAFHSPLMAGAASILDQAIAAVEIRPPRLPVYSNLDGRPYPAAEPDAIRARLSRHLLSPVEFVAQIEAIYAAGARCFLEVGPRAVLCGLVSRILADRPHRAIALDGADGGMRGLLNALGGLFVAGYTFDPGPLFAGRLVEAEQTRLAVALPSSQTFWVSGGGVRKEGPRPVIRPKSLTECAQLPTPTVAAAAQMPPIPSTNIQRVPVMSERSSETQTGALGPAQTSSGSSQPDTDTLLAVWQAYQETMRKFLEVQERVMTSFLGGQQPADTGEMAESQAPLTQSTTYPTLPEARPDRPAARQYRPSVPQAAVAPAPSMSPPAPAAESVSEEYGSIQQVSSLPDRSTLIAQITAIISECTGYPPELLDPDQALESELGIDSIKRVEILANIERLLPPQLAETMRAQMNRLSRAPTIHALVDVLLSLGPQDPPTGSGGPTSQPRSGSTPSPGSGVPLSATASQTRGMATGRATPLPQPQSPAESAQPLDRYRMVARAAPPPKRAQLPAGQILVLGEGGTAERLIQMLKDAGLCANQLAPQDIDPETLSQTILALRARNGPIAGLIQLAGLKAMDLPSELTAWQAESFAQVKSLFLLLKACAEDLRAQRGRILSASLLGGAFGRNGRCGPGLPLAAGNLGMLKTLKLEWPEVQVKAIDLAAGPEEALAEILIDEFLGEDEAIEISYQDGKRLTWEPIAAPWSAPSRQPVEPASDWVVLALGGARGITAQILHELIVPGMTLIILGRLLPLAEDDPLQGRTESELRAHYLAQAQARGEAATPVTIERRIKQTLRAAEIASHLAAFRACGARVEYHALDVRDHQALLELIDGIYRHYGRIDAVLQGVGQIEDKLLVDKSLDSFIRIFDLKADSTYLLCRALRPETLRLVLLFASVAGRTGNIGQCDYAAANEIINRLAWWMQGSWPKTRVLALNWGPWSGTGMANEAINRQFQARGVIPIDPDSGRRFIREELARGLDEVELIVGRFQPPMILPMLGNRRLRPDGNGQLRGSYRLELKRDLYLNDHRLDGVPVVPAAVALELLAEFVQTAWPDQPLTEVRDLRVLRGLTLQGEQGRELSLWAQLIHKSETRLEVLAEIREGDHPYYRANLILGGSLQPVALPPPLTEAQLFPAERAYVEHCFHGPCFRLLQGVLRIGAEGVEGSVQASDPRAWLGDTTAAGLPQIRAAQWLIDPGVVDALLQSTILWARIQHHTYPLPSRFRRVMRLSASVPISSRPTGARHLRFTQRVRRFTGPELEVDFILTDEDGRLILALAGIEAHCDPGLNRLAPQPDFYQPCI